MSYTVPNKVSLSQLSASSHVSASAFYGDGSNLTNIAAGGLTSVATGGNITGSGTSGNPVGIKPDPSFNTVTASVISANDVITNYINFNNSTDPTWENGRVWHNNTTHELNYWTEIDGFNIKIGQQLVQRCKNDQGSPLIKGSVVHITGSISSADTPRIRLADWTNDGLSANTLGLVAEDIDTGGEGYVIVQGILKGYNTNGYIPGEMLYLSSSGQITNIKPSAPKHTVSIGQVVRKQIESGSIYVSIQNGYELNELHDVLTNGKSNGDLLTWDSSSVVWKNGKILSGSYIISGSQTITGSLIATNSITSSNGISGRLYGTASYALDADLFDGQNSSLFALKTDVTSAYQNFSTRAEVSGAITGALTPYALSNNISSSFVTNAAATASFAFLTASNTFTTDQRINNGRLTISSSVDANIISASNGGDCYITLNDGAQTAILGASISNATPTFRPPFVGSSTNHDFVIRSNNTERMRFTNTGQITSLGDIIPNSSNTYKLGDSTKYWSDIYAYEIYGMNKVTAFNSVDVGYGGIIGDTWSWYVGPSSNTNFILYQNNIQRGYFANATTVNNIDFTGQHRCQPIDNIDNIENYIGLIVVAAGAYSDSLDQQIINININEAIPRIQLSNIRNDKKVFGVISNREDPNIREYAVGRFVSVYEKNQQDDRIIINSLGEGAIWITNINGNLENGDYITSCDIPGYGMKQDDDLLHNYTVAKITCDCDFDLDSEIYKCEEFQFNGVTYKRAFVGCTYHCG